VLFHEHLVLHSNGALARLSTSYGTIKMQGKLAVLTSSHDAEYDKLTLDSNWCCEYYAAPLTVGIDSSFITVLAVRMEPNPLAST